MTVDMEWLTAAREQQAALMVATCVIVQGGGLRWDPAQGKDVPQAGATVYSGPCSMLQQGVQARGTTAGGQQVNTRPLVVKVPHTVAGVRVGATVTVTSPDPDAKPAVLTVVDVGGGDMVTCRRLVCTREV